MEQITVEQYADGVKILLALAQGDVGGSRVAAQVLLSAFNGEAFQLDVVDLGNLDEKHYRAALSVIRGRTETRIEPHTLVANGDKVFPEIWKQWKGYHVQQRGQLYE